MKNIFIFLLFISINRVSLADEFWMGMLGDDGVVSPMVLYDGKSWSQHWPYRSIPTEYWYRVEDIFGSLFFLSQRDPFDPKPLPRDKYKASLDKIPAPWLGGTNIDIKSWYLYGRDEDGLKLNATNMKLHNSRCGVGIGLLTDYQDVNTENANLVVPDPPKDVGFVFTKPINIIPFEKNDSKDDDNIVSFLKSRFKTEEATMFKKIKDDREKRGIIKYPEGTSLLDETEKSDIEKYKYFSSDAEILGSKYHYVVLQRRYDPSKLENSLACETVRYVQTWLKEENNKIEILGENVYYGDCEMKGAVFFDPAFILPVNNKYYIISDKSGWEIRWYSIHKLNKNKMEPVMDIDDCPLVYG